MAKQTKIKEYKHYLCIRHV